MDEFTLACDSRADWTAMIDLVRDENGEGSEELESRASPTLLVWGAEDTAYRPDVYGARFEWAIPRARLVTIEGAGHYPHEEQPAVFVRTLSKFFDELEREPQ